MTKYYKVTTKTAGQNLADKINNKYTFTGNTLQKTRVRALGGYFFVQVRPEDQSYLTATQKSKLVEYDAMAKYMDGVPQ